MIIRNPKAFHDYFVEKQYEAGLVLTGTEIKSLLQNKGSIKEAICKVIKGEVFIFGMHISPYEFGNIWNRDPLRTRKLLLHKKEIHEIEGKISGKGYTLMPLDVHLSHGKAKLTLGICKGKKLWNKRRTLKERDIKKQLAQELKKTIR